jgi:hypothetical protein
MLIKNIVASQPFTRPRLAFLWPIVVFIVFAGLLALVQYGTPDLADNDGYYHIRVGQLIREQGLHPDFVWLPIGLLNPQDFYDHHLLYHVYLAFFTGDGSAAAMLYGAKLAAILMPAAAFTLIWWLLRSQRVPWATAWALGLCAISEAFLYRMSIPRAQSASLLVLALALYVLFSRRYIWLLPIGFVYVWLYNAFPLLLALVAAEAVATLLLERKLQWQALFFAMLGMLLGLIINPYFPANITFIFHHLLPKIGQPATSVGNEWYPYETWRLVENSGAAIALLALGAFALGWRGKRFDRITLTSFLLALFFGLLVLKARRFVEYFPPFALIFAALTIGPLLHEWYQLAAQQRAGETLIDRAIRSFQRLLPVLTAISLAVMLFLSLSAAREAMATSKSSATFAEASAWLERNTPAGSLVFQTDWDDFPRLFFYNTHNIYTIGLDPTYMQIADPELYDLWVQITRGKLNDPGATIRERFNTQFVISDLAHGDFIRKANNDRLMQEVYRDEYAVIYQIQ